MRLIFAFLLLFSVFLSCTDDDGVIQPDSTVEWKNLKTSDGLPSNEVYKLFEDSKANVWIGTDKGIALFDGERFKSFNQINAQLGYADAITEGPDGEIWVGSANGIALYEEGEWFFFNSIEGLDLGVISLQSTRAGKILMGTTNLGILIYDGSGFLQLYDEDCSECNSARVFLEDIQGQVWIGTDGGLKRLRGNQVTLFTTHGLSVNQIRTLEEDQWGRIWVGTLYGEDPLAFENERFRFIKMQNGLELNPIYALAEDRGGTMWLGLIKGGLITYDGAFMKPITSSEGPGLETIFSVIERSNGEIWAGTSTKGIFVYSPSATTP
ncbi:MAG: two-component regulator propeller domain-containing protein [Imperialibacter sp.]|uniref:ligand-binding sensor domain-containing protein n=1 Tax=Imperialibacter sp. TaxID=2038411 RepID=UPI0032EFEBA0